MKLNTLKLSHTKLRKCVQKGCYNENNKELTMRYICYYCGSVLQKT